MKVPRKSGFSSGKHVQTSCIRRKIYGKGHVLPCLYVGFVGWKRRLEYMLLFCEWTTGVWWAEPACCGLKIDRNKVRTFDQWFLEVCSSLTRLGEDGVKMKRLVAYNCWMVWKARCESLIKRSRIGI